MAKFNNNDIRQDQEAGRPHRVVLYGDPEQQRIFQSQLALEGKSMSEFWREVVHNYLSVRLKGTNLYDYYLRQVAPNAKVNSGK